jgi:hypothetical protein
MTEIATEDVLRLVASQVVGAEDRIERVYLWKFDRLMAAVKGAFVIAASLLAPLATVFFEGNVQAQWWWVLLLLTGLVAVGAFGFFSYRRLGQIYWAYLDNLLMLGFARQTTEVGS